MRALSSESPLTTTFTVEYKIGLKHPITPRRYHAKKLDAVSLLSPHNLSKKKGGGYSVRLTEGPWVCPR